MAQNARWSHEYLSIDRLISVDCDNRNLDGNIAESCGCAQRNRKGSSCLNTDCPNFAMLVECTKCANDCKNNRIQRGSHVSLNVIECPGRGLGITTNDPIEKGDLILEYVGEVISDREFKRRYKSSLTQQHLYMLQLDSNRFIDARHKGNVSRFINHSCSPNCTLEVWLVKGYLRAGVFALKPIAIGQEILADYEWDVSPGRKLTRCLCGSDNCRGFIELVDVDDDDDDDEWLVPPLDFDISKTPLVGKTIKIWRDEAARFESAYVASNAGSVVSIRWSFESVDVTMNLDEVNWLLNVGTNLTHVTRTVPKKEQTIRMSVISTLPTIDASSLSSMHHHQVPVTTTYAFNHASITKELFCMVNINSKTFRSLYSSVALLLNEISGKFSHVKLDLLDIADSTRIMVRVQSRRLVEGSEVVRYLRYVQCEWKNADDLLDTKAQVQLLYKLDWSSSLSMSSSSLSTSLLLLNAHLISHFKFPKLILHSIITMNKYLSTSSQPPVSFSEILSLLCCSVLITMKSLGVQVQSTDLAEIVSTCSRTVLHSSADPDAYHSCILAFEKRLLSQICFDVYFPLVDMNTDDENLSVSSIVFELMYLDLDFWKEWLIDPKSCLAVAMNVSKMCDVDPINCLDSSSSFVKQFLDSPTGTIMKYSVISSRWSQLDSNSISLLLSYLPFCKHLESIGGQLSVSSSSSLEAKIETTHTLPCYRTTSMSVQSKQQLNSFNTLSCLQLQDDLCQVLLPPCMSSTVLLSNADNVEGEVCFVMKSPNHRSMEVELMKQNKHKKTDSIGTSPTVLFELYLLTCSHFIHNLTSQKLSKTGQPQTLLPVCVIESVGCDQLSILSLPSCSYHITRIPLNPTVNLFDFIHSYIVKPLPLNLITAWLLNDLLPLFRHLAKCEIEYKVLLPQQFEVSLIDGRIRLYRFCHLSSHYVKLSSSSSSSSSSEPKISQKVFFFSTPECVASTSQFLTKSYSYFFGIFMFFLLQKKPPFTFPITNNPDAAKLLIKKLEGHDSIGSVSNIKLKNYLLEKLSSPTNMSSMMNDYADVMSMCLRSQQSDRIGIDDDAISSHVLFSSSSSSSSEWLLRDFLALGGACKKKKKKTSMIVEGEEENETKDSAINDDDDDVEPILFVPSDCLLPRSQISSSPSPQTTTTAATPNESSSSSSSSGEVIIVKLPVIEPQARRRSRRRSSSTSSSSSSSRRHRSKSRDKKHKKNKHRSRSRHKSKSKHKRSSSSSTRRRRSRKSR